MRVLTNVVIDVWRVDGARRRHVSRERQHNLTVDSGLNLIRDLINGGGGSGITHFALGNSAAASSSAQTTLVGELGRFLTTVRTPTSKTLTIKFFLDTPSLNGNILREIGLFNAASAGTMYARAVLASPITKTAALTVTFTWTLTWSPG